MKHVYALLMIALTPSLGHARILNSFQSGNFTTSSTWRSAGSPATPAAGDTLNIQSGHTVTIYANLSYSGSVMRINVYGTWVFDGPGDKISMPCNSAVMIYAGGTLQGTGTGSGNSQTITICSDTYWSGDSPPVSGPMAYPITVLPVEIIDFSGEARVEGVDLRWSTATETASSHFEVHRSSDMASWELVGSVDAVGNSTSINDYTFTDNTVFRGTWYYRLVQVDINGSEHGARLLGIEVPGKDVPLTCVPNPVTDGRIQAITGDVMDTDPRPMVRDLAMGRRVGVTDYKVNGDRVNVVLPGLANGTYLLELRVNDIQRSCRFVVQR